MMKQLKATISYQHVNVVFLGNLFKTALGFEEEVIAYFSTCSIHVLHLSIEACFCH